MGGGEGRGGDGKGREAILRSSFNDVRSSVRGAKALGWCECV